MDEMTLKFSENDVGINILKFMNNSQIDASFRKMFSTLKPNEDGIITIDQFIDVLEKNNWKITHKNFRPEYENIKPEKYNEYVFQQKKIGFKKYVSKLHLFFPSKYNIPKYQANYNTALEKLINLSKEAIVINSNVTDFNRINNQFNDYNAEEQSAEDYTPNLQLIKGTVYQPTIKKISKKGKIVLCTLAVIVTVVAGSFIAHTIKVLAETQEELNNNQYSYQTDSSSDSINQKRYLQEAIKNGEIDNSLDPNNVYEAYTMGYVAENNQNVR